MKVTIAVASAALSLVSATQVFGQDAKPACKAMDAALPAELSGWTSKGELASATKASDLSKAALVPGKAVTATLHPTRQVTYVTQPEKPGGSVASGGLFDLDVAEPGTYRVVLSTGAWLDVLDHGKAVISTAHKPGPACSTARKTVEFPLKRGRYVVQVSANADPTIGMAVIRVP